MPLLKIDLSTKVLSKDMKVHLVRPGARYAFFDTIVKESLLPVDAPLLPVEDGKPVKSAQKIVKELERARAFRNWAKQPATKRGARPTRDLESYALDLIDPRRAATRTKIRNAAHDILWKIPGGTLIVVPCRTLSGQAILARIAPRRAPRGSVEGRGRNKGIWFPARKIHDIQLVPMIDLPGDVLEAARTVKVVQLITGHAEDRILRMYFGDYQRADEHVAGVVGGTDDFDARIIGQMIELHLAIANSNLTGQAVQPGSALFDPNNQAEVFFHGRVDSPDGKTFLESATSITFAVKLMLITAAAGVSTDLAAQAIETGNVEVINSMGDTNGETVRASRQALVDFAEVSGYSSVSAYLKALQDGLNRNSATIAGKAELEE